MLGRRAAGPGFEHATALHQLDDRQHLGRGAQFQNGEQVGQIVAQHVAGDRDRILALADCLQRLARGLGGGHDLELVGHALGFKDRLHIGDQLCVMGAVLVQPEDRLAAFGFLTVDGQLHPVLDRGLAGRGRAPDVVRLDAVLGNHVAIGGDHFHGAVSGDLERGGVRPVFLGFLRHQTDVLHSARGRRVQRAGFFEVINAFFIDRGI